MEDNKLIMDFMGLAPKKSGDHYSYSDGIFFTSRSISEQEVYDSMIRYVKYATSWDWLMSVVDKCSLYEVESLNDVTFDVEFYMFLTNDISAVYSKVVDFIKQLTKH